MMVIIPKIRFEQLRATRAISQYVSVRRTATADGSYYDGALDRLVRRLAMLRRQLAWARSVECLRSHCRCRGRPSGVWWGTQSERALHRPCRKTATFLLPFFGNHVSETKHGLTDFAKNACRKSATKTLPFFGNKTLPFSGNMCVWGAFCSAFVSWATRWLAEKRQRFCCRF